MNTKDTALGMLVVGQGSKQDLGLPPLAGLPLQRKPLDILQQAARPRMCCSVR